MRQAEQINFRQWHELFKTVPEDLVENTRYYRDLPDAEWSQYLFPPSTYNIYGNRILRKLKFDNSDAALRLWGFVLSESERLYRARQAGKKVIAVMGDLGAVTPLIYSFENTIAFYPDCLWWTPFLMESKVLFDEAADYGIGEDCCFVRAALGAYSRKAYFPKPDLSIATVGATCDDMAAVISEIEFLKNNVHYMELPHRNDFVNNSENLKAYLAGNFENLCAQIEKATGQQFSDTRFRQTLKKVNHLRKLISNIKETVAGCSVNTFGGNEMMNVAFSALSYYADLDECIAVLEDTCQLLLQRNKTQNGYPGQDIRIVWVTPPADPLLFNYIEELGGRVVGYEYVINQTTPNIKENGNPFEALATAQLESSLMGSSEFRAKLVYDEIVNNNADGVIISGIFGSSHCPYETSRIVDSVRKKDIPVLAFDVVASGKKRMQSQIYNRMEAFMESLRHRKHKAGWNAG